MRIFIEHQDQEGYTGHDRAGSARKTGIKTREGRVNGPGPGGRKPVVNTIYSLNGSASDRSVPAFFADMNGTNFAGKDQKDRDYQRDRDYPKDRVRQRDRRAVCSKGRRETYLKESREACPAAQREEPDCRFMDHGLPVKPRRRWFVQKIWNSQTGRWWLVVLFLILVMAVLMPLWGKVKVKDEGVIAEEMIRVLMPSGDVGAMVLEEYLIGVVAAEMPAAFEPEALKAQAVASRTFAARRIDSAQESGESYDVDTTTATQVWRSEDQMRERWGSSYDDHRARIAEAVEQTKGEVLMFDDVLATTVFFSNTGRLPTENSTDVWGGDVGYLISVSSPETAVPEEYVRTKEMSVAEFLQALSISGVKSLKASDIKVLERTAAGRIARISVAGQTVKGTDFRRALELASTDIEWKISDGRIFFTTYGNGHAVGLSQYGAQDMALGGSGYKDILAHYYQGTELASGFEI